ncbi:hypothetical protein W1080910_175 [Cyanophage S-RIM12 isolate W1_08_0910]|uniref:Uncharacterized protein n=2 Tax=Brizovirus TaxID=2733098 RepID=A0A1D7SS40_9CAUD|nr:major head protein [Cyanophage S-RIM12 isolate RW_06_0310]YP_009779584.1 major head protein [Cyanophage S-RIM12 isolate W1_08_0910]AOO16517.1 hypothetical protein RW060310_175 [Cyanophage S-RIM12 isolate RW_06_0310]AOO18666.1 hypothetical protein W1080910_175 [Cyanophage S-RIM12 isolate W1_08_0910]
MNEEMMTTGFTGSDADKGPTAGFDPVMKFRSKLKKKSKEDKKLVMPGNKLGESKENPSMPSRLFQYKVTIPEVGETIVYASSPAELRQKMRLLINYRYRGEIKIERIMPANAGKFFMDKRMNHLRNVKENVDKQMQQQMTQQQIANEKKKVNMKIKELQSQLQKKTASLKLKARAGGAQATVDR